MYSDSARQFGIDKKEGLLKTFMSNDWMHGVLVNHQIDDSIKTMASLILGAQITISAIATLYFQSRNVSAEAAINILQSHSKTEYKFGEH